MAARYNPPKALVLFLGLSLFALPGCAIRMDLPESFLELERNTQELKATTPDEALLWVRKFKGPKKGSKLGFWREALKNDFVNNRGYTLIREAKTQDLAGAEGAEMVFEVSTQGQAQRYLVTLFVREGSWLWLWPGSPTICVVEFVAPRELFEDQVAEVQKAVGSLDF